jgi:hypothetical protein
MVAVIESELEQQFDCAVMQAVAECRAFGYNPAYFIRMRSQDGTRDATAKLLNDDKSSDGFNRLVEQGRMELTLEAIIWDNPIFWPLFHSTVLKKAFTRLVKAGYIG